MFALHESTRRGLCRMGFVLLCVLPVCAIAGASVWLHSDSQRKASEKSLSQLLSLDVSIDRVVLTQPNGIRYEGVRLADPETGASVAQAASITVVKERSLVAIGMVDSKVSTAHTPLLKDVVMRQLRLGKAGESIRLWSDKLEWQCSDKSIDVVEDVQANFAFDSTTAEFVAEFRPTNCPLDKRIWLGVKRDRQTLPATTKLVFNSVEAPLACSTLAAFVPAVERFGSDCLFSGKIWDEGSVGGGLTGKFKNVDLSAFAGNGFPDHLQGKAEIDFKTLSFIDGRIDRASGQVQCNGGILGPSLIELIDPRGTRRASVSFNELKFGFDLDGEGIVLTGDCTDHPGTILTDERGNPIVATTTAKPIPLFKLEKIFSQSRTAKRLLPSPDATRR
jgi:hypothetical protein